VPVRVRVRTPVAFCESGDETEVWVPFCGGEVPLPEEDPSPEEEPLPEAGVEADGRVTVGV